MLVLIVDDHPIVRSGLRRLLTGEAGWEVHEAINGKEALSVFRACRPDLVVLDLSMPGTGGLVVIRRLRSDDPAVRMLVLSMHHDKAKLGAARTVDLVRIAMQHGLSQGQRR